MAKHDVCFAVLTVVTGEKCTLISIHWYVFFSSFVHFSIIIFCVNVTSDKPSDSTMLIGYISFAVRMSHVGNRSAIGCAAALTGCCF